VAGAGLATERVEDQLLLKEREREREGTSSHRLLMYRYMCFKRVNVQYLSKVQFNFKEINKFIQQGHIKLIKSDKKYFYNVTKDFYFK